ncbi:MAG: hypothetical protein H6739_03590 [Alphaproteobacteria bacterium]|nr:hypothetical protein [Alphaproteobacteria bacterium]
MTASLALLAALCSSAWAKEPPKEEEKEPAPLVLKVGDVAAGQPLARKGYGASLTLPLYITATGGAGEGELRVAAYDLVSGEERVPLTVDPERVALADLPVVLTLRAEGLQPGDYTGLLELVAPEQTARYPLTVTMAGPREQLKLEVTSPQVRRSRKGVPLTLTVEETAGYATTVEPPFLRKFQRVEGDKTTDVPVDIEITEGEGCGRGPCALPAKGARQIGVTLGNLPAGQYSGTAEIRSPSGQSAAQAFTVQVQGSGLAAFIAILVGVVSAGGLARWTKEGRPHNARREQLALLKENAEALPADHWARAAIGKALAALDRPPSRLADDAFKAGLTALDAQVTAVVRFVERSDLTKRTGWGALDAATQQGFLARRDGLAAKKTLDAFSGDDSPLTKLDALITEVDAAIRAALQAALAAATARVDEALAAGDEALATRLQALKARLARAADADPAQIVALLQQVDALLAERVLQRARSLLKSWTENEIEHPARPKIEAALAQAEAASGAARAAAVETLRAALAEADGRAMGGGLGGALGGLVGVEGSGGSLAEATLRSLDLTAIRARAARYERLAAVVSGVVVTLVGFDQLYLSDPTWGGGRDLVWAFLWAFGFQAGGSYTLEGVLGKLQGEPEA